MQVVLIDFHLYAYSVALANALAEHGEVTLMLPDTVAEHYLQALRPDVKCWQFHLWRQRYPLNIVAIASILRKINAVNPQIVHVLSGFLWMDLALPLLRSRALVTTVHDAHIHPGDRESSALGHSLGWKCATQVSVHAEAIKQQLVQDRGVKPDKVHVVPHGTYDFYRRWASDEINEEPNTVLFFGRIWDYKGLQYLIEAEPLITARVPNARIVIAGRGEDFGKYERLMVNRDRFVVLNERIPDEAVARLFQQASVVVCPYIEASQSGVLALANAFGKPVVATTVGGIPEMIAHGKTGLLVPPRDTQSLAEAIITLLQNHTLRQEMRLHAQQQAQTELSWKSIAKRTLAVYTQAVAAHAGLYPTAMPIREIQ
ncbi:MAG TPA: glycosyltransferase family 4 protein [Blastocatellia bacterium]|nr:glycosyltransferase family 4 protein [Blastocatellia bacterium]